MSRLIWILLGCALVACGDTGDRGPGSAGDIGLDTAEPPQPEVDDEVIPGRWRLSRRPPIAELTPEQQARIEELEAVGYVGGSQPPRTNSVITVHDTERAASGLNLWTSGHQPMAFLMDMEGLVLHQWYHDFWEIWPDHTVDPENNNMDFWRRVYLYPNGDLLAIFEGLGLVKLDKDSNVLWAVDNQAHHDLEVLPDGDIFVLTRDAHLVPRLHETEPVLEDYISVLDPEGREQKRVSLLECFERSEFDDVRTVKKRFQGDIFHTNTLAVLDDSIAYPVPWLKPGYVVTSMRYLDAVAIVDLEREVVVRAWNGVFARQHDPKILPNGHMLLFDNLGEGTRSRVLELDLETQSVEWEYSGSEDYPLYTLLCGAASRLDNGNTLITESDHGRALEVSPDGDVVWEFYNPFRVGEDPQYIATLFEMVRLPADFPVAWADTEP